MGHSYFQKPLEALECLPGLLEIDLRHSNASGRIFEFDLGHSNAPIQVFEIDLRHSNASGRIFEIDLGHSNASGWFLKSIWGTRMPQFAFSIPHLASSQRDGRWRNPR
jgi:hypothetical protein